MFGRKNKAEAPKEEKAPDIDPRLLQILKEAEFIKGHVATQMGISLEYNYACMLQIDLLIDKLLGGSDSQEPEKMARIFGSYFGECVRRTFSGRWAFTEDGQAILVDIGGSDLKVLPYNTLRARVCDKEEMKVFFTSQFIASELAKKYRKTLYKDIDDAS